MKIQFLSFLKNQSLSKSCKKCSNECFECESENKCISYNTCKKGEYKDLNDKSCYPCNDGCSECLSKQKCLSCLKGFYLFQNQCKTTCLQGYYQDQLLCQECQDNTTKCSICQSAAYKEQDTGFCVKKCRQGYYQDDLNGICSPCHSSCIICDGISENQCLECQSSLFLEDGKCVKQCNLLSLEKICVTQCPLGYFINEQKQCKKCLSGCQECQIREDLCTKCFQSSYFISDKQKCVDLCPIGYYTNQNLMQCLHCMINCIQCKDESQCLMCDPQYFLDKGKCIQKCDSKQKIFNFQCLDGCPESTYLSSDEQNCYSCNRYCQSCTDSSNNCSKCSHFGFMLEGKCLQTCSDGYYPDSNNICQKCSSNCLTCSQEQICKSCNTNLNLLNNKCIEICPQLVQEGQCVSQCSISYYQYQNNCLRCNTNCKICKDETSICPVCSDSAFRINSNCGVCPLIGYFSNIELRQCEQCNDKCLTCFGSTVDQCLSCQKQYLLQKTSCVRECFDLIYQGECRTDCPISTYIDYKYKTCKSCSILCDICTDNTNRCSKCSQIAYKSKDFCVAQCPFGQFGDISKHCIDCDPNCLTCDGSFDYNCLSCKINFYLFNNQCVKECPTQYYPQQSSSTCVLCDSKGRSYKQCMQLITISFNALNQSNKFKLEFSQPIQFEDTISDENFLLNQLVIIVDGITDFKVDIKRDSQKSFVLTFETSEYFLIEKRIQIALKDPTKIKIKNDETFISPEYSAEVQQSLEQDKRLFSYLYPQISVTDKEALSMSTEKSAMVISGFLLPISIVASQVISSLIVSIAQIFNYWMYIDMYLPPNLEMSLRMLKLLNFEFLPNIGEDITIQQKLQNEIQAKDKKFFGHQIVDQKARYRFEQRGELTTSFLLNGLNKINIIILIFLLSFILKKLSKINIIFKISIVVDLILINFINSTIIPLDFAVILQLSNFSEENVANVISYVISLFVFFAFAFHLIKQTFNSLMWFKQRDQMKFDDKFEEQQPLFKDFYLDKSQQLINFIFPHLLSFKDILTVYIIIVYYDTPPLILSSICTLQLIQLILIIYYIKYKEKLIWYLNIFNCLVILIMIFLFIILYFFNIEIINDKVNQKALFDQISVIGWIIISLFLIMVIANIIIIFTQVYHTIKKHYYLRLKYNQQGQLDDIYDYQQMMTSNQQSTEQRYTHLSFSPQQRLKNNTGSRIVWQFMDKKSLMSPDGKNQSIYKTNQQKMTSLTTLDNLQKVQIELGDIENNENSISNNKNNNLQN